MRYFTYIISDPCNVTTLEGISIPKPSDLPEA